MGSARHDQMTSNIHTLLAEFRDGLDDDRRLGVAVSGGSDSLGLLYGLVQAVGPSRLVALTVDHRLRPASSDEARHVKSLCRRVGVCHETLVWEGDKPSAGLQAAARTARYQLLGHAAARLGLAAVLTGHTLDDQQETLAMRRARGLPANAPGLAGIPPATLFAGRMWVVRPLLRVRRAEIRAILTAAGIVWIEDPSNSDPRFERVRVRAALKSRPADAEGGCEGRAIAARCRLALDVAEHIETHCRIDLDGAARIRLRPDSVADVTMAAITALIDLAGGASRTLDRRGKTTLETFVRGAASQSTITLGRTVLRRRGGDLIVRRERRGLDRCAIPAGATADWDGRYRVHNLDRTSALAVGAGQAQGVSPLFSRDCGEGSPAWRLDHGVIGGFRADPLVGRYSRILPVYELPLAQAAARLRGAARFPECPWINSGDFKAKVL